MNDISLLKPRSRSIENSVLEPSIADIVKVLRSHGYWLSKIEERLTQLEGSRRIPRGDPPCIVCGRWSDDVLCPECRKKYGWMR